MTYQPITQLERIVHDNLTFVYKLSERLTGRFDPEYYSAAHFALYRCACEGEEDRGYITSAVKREIFRAMKANNRYQQLDVVWAAQHVETPGPLYSARTVIKSLKSGADVAEDYYIGGLTVEEIADRKQVPFAEVRNQLRHATRELMKVIESD